MITLSYIYYIVFYYLVVDMLLNNIYCSDLSFYKPPPQTKPDKRSAYNNFLKDKTFFFFPCSSFGFISVWLLIIKMESVICKTNRTPFGTDWFHFTLIMYCSNSKFVHVSLVMLSLGKRHNIENFLELSMYFMAVWLPPVSWLIS